jgi:DNA-binding MarR family transcriptional regulator
MTEAGHVLPQDRERCVCTTLRTLARQTTAIYESYLKKTGLRQPQYGVLARLDRLTQCSLSELAEATELDITSASRSVRTLIKAGLIQGTQGRDGRTKSYRLSPHGKRTLREGFRLWKQAQVAMRRLLSKTQLDDLAIIASAVATAAKAA